MASLLCRPPMCGYHSGEGREASLILRQAWALHLHGPLRGGPGPLHRLQSWDLTD